MPRSKSRVYAVDKLAVGDIYGDFTITNIHKSDGRVLADVKCNLCGVLQEALAYTYVVKKGSCATRGCYACYRSHKEKKTLTREEAQARRAEYWARSRKKQKEARAADPEKAARYKESARAYVRNLSWARHRLMHLKSRAIKQGVPWEADAYEGLDMPAVCPVLGIPLFKGTGGPTMNSPSIDRKVPSMGYVKGNIQIISQLANGMKQNATPEQLLAFAEWVQKTYAQ